MESNISTQDTMKDIVKIAMLLRDEGDRILNFSCKLSLTTDFLINLNEAFDLIVDNVESPSFQVINTNNSSIEFLHDLQFLHDFVQKVLCLRLTSKTPIFERKVSLGKFRTLCFLDLYGVPIESIGISSTKNKLKSLVCRRCKIRDLNNLFEPGGSDSDDSENESSKRRTWLCLEEVFLPHNNLESLGYSLHYLPKLRILDMSYNNLTDISALDKNIDNLEWLNVSFNHLQTIPTLTQCTKLKTLLISDNRIEDLKGLCRISSLQHVDASRNLIKSHSSLTSLVNLQFLEKLQLEGNPCAFRRGHRLLTIANLNPWVLTSQIFFLDGVPLSSLEKSHFLPKQPFKHYKESIAEVSISDHCCSSPSHSTQPSSFHQQECVAEVQQPKNLLNSKREIATTSRVSRIREAPIAEGEECQVTSSLENQTDTSSLSMAGSTTHKDTKRDIESLRKTFGEENWLQGGGGRMILDILGLRLGPANSSSSVASLPESFVTEGADLTHDKPISGIEELAEEEDGGEGKERVLEADVKEAEEEEIDDSESIGEIKEVENGVELGVFVVQKKRIKGDCVTMDDLLLVVTDRFLAECDVTNGAVVAKWDLCRLQRIIHHEKENDEIKGTEVVVTFKETWEMPEECLYILDDTEAKELVGIVEGILDVTQATVAESALLFTCVKCSTNFFGTSCPSESENFVVESEKKADQGQIPKCPKCGSVVVVHADSIEEKASSPADDVLTSTAVAVAEAGPHKEFDLEKTENKNPFTFWSKSKLSSSMKANTEASDRGLRLYVLLNVLPDGMGKENDLNIHEAVIFKEGSEEYFHGHIVLSTDSIYVLRREAAGGSKVSEGKSLSSEESSEPILFEWHPLSNCSAITQACSGYFFQFGPSPPSCLWIFPRHQEEMQQTLESLSNTLKDLQCFESIEEQTKAPRKLGEILMATPILAFSSHFSDNSQLDQHDPFSSSEIERGVLILTPSIISVIDYKDLQFFRTDFDYIPSCTKRISDLIGLDAAPYSMLQLPGVVFHFSGESDEDAYAIWPWGEDALFNLVESLRKPWEKLFSIPLEAIVAQVVSQGI